MPAPALPLFTDGRVRVSGVAALGGCGDHRSGLCRSSRSRAPDWRSDPSHSWQVASYQAAKWVKANLPADAVIAMKDAGNMGFYSDRPVVIWMAW